MKKIFTVMAALILLSLVGCNTNSNKADGYGNFEATEVTVSSEANGRLLSFTVHEGDQVVKGQLLGVIDTVQLSLKKEQLKAAKNTIYSKSLNVLSQREVLLEQLSVAQKNQARVKNLIQNLAATQKELDDVNGKVKILKQRIKSVETQNAPIINEIKDISIQIEQIEDQIEKSLIRNPAKGTVLIKYAEPGEITAFGKPLYKIADLSIMQLRVYVSETQLPNIKLGQEVTVKIDSDDTMKYYNGTLSWVASEAEFTPKIVQTKEERVALVYAVKINVLNDGSLKIGMPAEMTINQ